MPRCIGSTGLRNAPDPSKPALFKPAFSIKLDPVLMTDLEQPAPEKDPAENRLRFGCLAALVAVGVLFFAFAMGAITTYTSYKEGRLTDPWGQDGEAQILEMPPEEPAPQSDAPPHSPAP